MNAQQAIELIEQEIRWHETRSNAYEGTAFQRGFLAGLRQARGLVASASMMEANHHHREAETLRKADARLYRTSDIAAQYGRKPS